MTPLSPPDSANQPAPPASDSGARLKGRVQRLLVRIRVGTFVARVFRDDAVRAAFFVFLLSRTIILAILILTGVFKAQEDPYNPGHRTVTISVKKIQMGRILAREVLAGDVNWYIGIAANGYERRAFDTQSAHNWAFFPLYPLLLRMAHKVTNEYVVTGMMLSQLFFFCALVLLYKLCAAFGMPDDAYRAISYVAFFPVSYFFSLPLTESLFLMLTLASFLAAKREKWWLAGIAGAFASATRFSGLLLLPALAVLYVQTTRSQNRRPRLNACWLLLIPVGLFAFMLFLHFTTGNALAFKDVQGAWGRQLSSILTPLLDYLSYPTELASNWDFRVLNFAAAVTSLACCAVLIKRKEFALATYTLFSVVLTLSTLFLQSQARYAMVIFPIYLVLARVGRHDRVDQSIRIVFLSLLVLMTAMFAAHFTIALS